VRSEEAAFYDALVEIVKKMPKLDWAQRESVRADLRRKVRRRLAMYGYPTPIRSASATLVVLKALFYGGSSGK
jgi:type I restriction enzyme R subunit